MENSCSKECQEALKLLARSKNVLISGPPGTGKSRLLAEVGLAFESGYGSTPAGGPPRLSHRSTIPIPPAAGGTNKEIPSPDKKDRKVFRTVFHQNSKYRDFVSGIIPSLNKARDGADFTIIKGTLYRASEHAKPDNCASLLIIDEINRGPAVQVFGDSIVAIESDKRLAPDGSKRVNTQYFELLDPTTGETIEYALPNDLYILAVMNQADASVEPLDVAFLRRWEPLRLEPSESLLREFYGLREKGPNKLPETPKDISDALEASVRAWVLINEQITVGRGSEFQIGHGVLMPDVELSTLNLSQVLGFLCVGWAKIRAHVEEVFFGDTRATAAAINALDGPEYNPFRLTETTFADDIRFSLEGPTNFTEINIYPALRAFSRE